MTLAEEIATIVHAFDDKGRKDSVRRLSARVAELEAQLKDAVEAERKSCTSLAEWAIAEAVAKEREACAKLAEETPCAGDESWWAAETAIAAAIRARGAR